MNVRVRDAETKTKSTCRFVSDFKIALDLLFPTNAS